MLETIIVQKALVINDGKILILRRSDTDDRRPLQWDLPGGRLDGGETLEQGIVREITEECGLQVTGVSLVFSKTEYREWPDGKNNVVFMFYKTNATSTNITLSYEHDQSQWVTIKEAIDLFEYNLHRELFEYVLNYDVQL